MKKVSWRLVLLMVVSTGVRAERIALPDRRLLNAKILNIKHDLFNLAGSGKSVVPDSIKLGADEGAIQFYTATYNMSDVSFEALKAVLEKELGKATDEANEKPKSALWRIKKEKATIGIVEDHANKNIVLTGAVWSKL